MAHDRASDQPLLNLTVHQAARALPPSRFLGPLLPERDGPNWINCLAWSPDASIVATGTGDNYNGEEEAAAWLWDAMSGSAVAKIDPNSQRINTLAWHPNSEWLAIAHGSHCSIFCPDPLAAGTNCDRWQRTAQPRCIFSATLARAADPTRWDDYSAGPPRPLDRRWSPRPDVFTVAWSPDGQYVVGAGADHQVRIWDVASGQLDTVLVGHTESVRSAYVHPQGEWILTASTDHTVRVWERATGACCAILKGPDVALNEALWSPDGRTVLATYADMTVACWPDWQALDTAPQLYTGGWAGRWSPDGRWIAILGKGRDQI